METRIPSNSVGGAAGGPGIRQLTVNTPSLASEKRTVRNAKPARAVAGSPIRSVSPAAAAPGATSKLTKLVTW
jgi:hypothetical protein